MLSGVIAVALASALAMRTDHAVAAQALPRKAWKPITAC